VTRGDFLLMPSSGVEYHGRHNPGQFFDVSWLYFRVMGWSGVLGGIAGLPMRVPLADAAFAERIMERLLASSGALRGTWLRVLLDEVRRQHTMRVASESAAQMRELGERVRANPGRYRGLDDMRCDYHYSKDHLIRLFRGCHGVTPVEFMIRARVESARALLTATSFSVKQIAAQLGYADAYCFSRQFKARTGIAPTQYRGRT
jgi:transcriptional regulator GlxA family with amidase domain